MKKILLTLSLLFTAIIGFAQNYGDDNTITFGLAGGSDFAYLQLKSPYRDDIYTDAENPFSLGFNADFKFNDYFSIRPGIFYAGKGGTMNAIYVDPEGNNVSVTDDYRLHYLEVPVDFIGHLPVGDGANNNQQISDDGAINHKVTFGSNGDFKSTDYGITTVLGFQGAKGWSISGNLDWGLPNILQTNNTGFATSQIKTITFYLSIGQSF
jgi:hypothetical protein